MALIVFLRGINVGGHRTLRPSILASALSNYDVVNVGAAGTFVVRKPGSRAKFRAELLRQLPFEGELVLCDGRDLIGLEIKNPFETEPSRPDIVRFVSILSRPGRVPIDIPFTLPPRGEWFVRVIASRKRFVFGVYRQARQNFDILNGVDQAETKHLQRYAENEILCLSAWVSKSGCGSAAAVQSGIVGLSVRRTIVNNWCTPPSGVPSGSRMKRASPIGPYCVMKDGA
jgi:Protein of unknown function (DUF1697)